MSANLSDKKVDFSAFRASANTLANSQWETQNGHPDSQPGVYLQVPTNSSGPNERVFGVKRVMLVTAEELVKGGVSDEELTARIDRVMRTTVVRVDARHGEIHLNPESQRYRDVLKETVIDARVSSRMFIQDAARLTGLRDQLTGPDGHRTGFVVDDANIAMGNGKIGRQFEALFPPHEAQITQAAQKALAVHGIVASAQIQRSDAPGKPLEGMALVGDRNKLKAVTNDTAKTPGNDEPITEPEVNALLMRDKPAVTYTIDLHIKNKADAMQKQLLLEKMGFATDKGGADGKVDGYFQQLSKQAAEDFRIKLSDAAFIAKTDPKILEEAKIAFNAKEAKPLSSKEVAEVSAAIGAGDSKTSRAR